MTQDEIIEMAKRAGAKQMVSSLTHPNGPVTALKFDLDSNSIEAFAKLVDAKATAKAIDEANARSNTSWTLMCKKMVEDEREACAKEVENALYGQEGCDKAAKAIRNRGEA